MQTTTTVAQTDVGPAKPTWRAARAPLVIALGALLALQLLLALALELGGRDMTPAGSQGPLLAFDPKKVTAIRIQTASGKPVLIDKTESGWIIPSLGDLPAAEYKVTELLTKLEGLKKGLPVVTSEEALKRFKVADQTFERKLTLEQGAAAPAILYLGDSPGFRRLFVRAAGDSAVYDAALGLFDAPDKADDWSDRTLLHLKTEDIQKLTIGGVTLERKDDSWKLSDLAEGEQQNEQASEDAVRQVAELDFIGVVAGDQKPEVAKDATPIEVTVTLKSGETLKYHIAKLAQGGDYLLEVSDRPQRFTLASYAVQDLIDMKRTKLLKETEKAVESPQQEPPQAGAPVNEDTEQPSTPAAPPPPAQAPEAGKADAPDAAANPPAAVPVPAAPRR